MFEQLRRFVSKFFSAVDQEVTVIETLHHEVEATLNHLETKDPGLKELLHKAHAYAIFPSVGKASVVIGGAFGKGEVFQKDRLVGYAGIVQLTLGVQLGGETFTEVIAFESKQAFDRFKAGRVAFAANAAAVLVKAGAAGSANYESGAAVFVYSEGGMLLEAAIGGQKFFFRPAVLGRGKKAEDNSSANGAKDKKNKAPNEKKAKPEKRSKPAASRKSTGRTTPGKQVRESAARPKRSPPGHVAAERKTKRSRRATRARRSHRASGAAHKGR